MIFSDAIVGVASEHNVKMTLDTANSQKVDSPDTKINAPLQLCPADGDECGMKDCVIFFNEYENVVAPICFVFSNMFPFSFLPFD